MNIVKTSDIWPLTWVANIIVKLWAEGKLNQQDADKLYHSLSEDERREFFDKLGYN